MTDSLVKWLLFRVALGWLPFGFGVILVFLISADRVARAEGFFSLFSGGQVSLLAVALCGGALGEVLIGPVKTGWVRGILGFSNLVMLISCGFFYGAAQVAVRLNPQVDKLVIANGAGLIYAMGFLSALFTMVICERAKALSAAARPDAKSV